MLFVLLVLQISSDMRQVESCPSSARSYQAGLVVASRRAEMFYRDTCPKKFAIVYISLMEERAKLALMVFYILLLCVHKSTKAVRRARAHGAPLSCRGQNP